MQEIIELLSQVEKRLTELSEMAWNEDHQIGYFEMVEEIEQLTLLITAIKHKVGLKI